LHPEWCRLLLACSHAEPDAAGPSGRQRQQQLRIDSFLQAFQQVRASVKNVPADESRPRCEVGSNGVPQGIADPSCACQTLKEEAPKRAIRGVRTEQIPDRPKPTFVQNACTRTSSCCLERRLPSTYSRVFRAHQEAAACLRRIDRRLLWRWQRQTDSVVYQEGSARV
jgi:hypothetical protein